MLSPHYLSVRAWAEALYWQEEILPLLTAVLDHPERCEPEAQAYLTAARVRTALYVMTAARLAQSVAPPERADLSKLRGARTAARDALLAWRALLSETLALMQRLGLCATWPPLPVF